MKIWFTSDTHFGHKNVIHYCNRPFSSVDSMTEGMISRWNEKVKEEDLVYHLGDFAFLSKSKLAEIVNRLNGKIILIQGNHDSNSIRSLFWESHKSLEVNVNGKTIHLSHYPKSHECGLVLCGHVHEKWKVADYSGITNVNVGVDVWDYYPVSFEEIALFLENSKVVSNA